MYPFFCGMQALDYFMKFWNYSLAYCCLSMIIITNVDNPF